MTRAKESVKRRFRKVDAIDVMKAEAERLTEGQLLCTANGSYGIMCGPTFDDDTGKSQMLLSIRGGDPVGPQLLTELERVQKVLCELRAKVACRMMADECDRALAAERGGK